MSWVAADVSWAAATGRPAAARSRSARISNALWYRSSRSLASDFITIASMSGGIDGSRAEGGVGISRTCDTATDTSDSPTKGGRPVSIS